MRTFAQREKLAIREKFLVVGHIAKDLHMRIDDCSTLPKQFSKLIKNSLPISRTAEVLGKGWTFDRIVKILEDHMVVPPSWSYGGRAPNVAYGAALLGAKVGLVGFVGEDFDKPYPGFYDGGYRTHLTAAGVSIRELGLSLEDLSMIDEETHDHGIIVVQKKEVPTVYCIKDSRGMDFYFIDDAKGAHTVASNSPIPTRLVKECCGVFVTSGEQSFNRRLISCARKQEKQIFFDVGAYDLSGDYLREIVPLCNVILGNLYELKLVREAFRVDCIGDLFDISSSISTIMLEDKIACTTTIFRRNKISVTVGPTKAKMRVSSVGCCDGMAAGYLGLRTQGYDSLTAAKAGLILCANIWRFEGVQEGMLSMEELLHELKQTRIRVRMNRRARHQCRTYEKGAP